MNPVATSQPLSPSGSRMATVAAPMLEESLGLLYRIHWPENRGFRTLGLIAAGSAHGVTLITQQLAASAATFPERRIVMVDANWHNAQLTRNTLTSGKSGLTDFFAGDVLLGDAILPTRYERLSVMPAGSAAGKTPLHSVSSEQWVALLDQLRDTFDLVIVDLPSLERTHSQLGLAGLLDGILFVLHASGSQQAPVRNAKQVLHDCGANLVGAIWNDGAKS